MAQKLVLVRKVTSIQKAIEHNIQTIKYTIHGQHQSGEWRVKHNGKNALVNGEASVLIPTYVEDGKQKYTKKLIGVTNGFIRGKEGEISFIAKCEASQKLYRVVGQLTYCLPKKPTPVQPVVIDSIVSAPVPVQPIELTQQPDLKEKSIASPDLTLVKEQKKLELRALDEQKFYSLLNIVQAQLAAGQDPLVPISYFSRVSKRSRATLYREQGTVIPKFEKIGKSSFLFHSDLENYMAGRPAALRNQSDNTHTSTTVRLVQKAA
jgi:hypothetical protein